MPDWRRLWENRGTLPPTSHRKFAGPLVVGVKRLFQPLGDLFLSARLETQREFNLHLLRELEVLTARMEELARDAAEMREEIRKSQAWFQERLLLEITSLYFQSHLIRLCIISDNEIVDHLRVKCSGDENKI